jgi:hypothetical protein
MTDALNNSPHFVFVPTDKTFNLYSTKAKVDALLADPKAAAAFLMDYIVEGYYPYGTFPGYAGAVLNGPPPSALTLTTLSGKALKLTGVAGLINGKNAFALKLNGQQLGDEYSTIGTANGTRFWPISFLLQAP